MWQAGLAVGQAGRLVDGRAGQAGGPMGGRVGRAGRQVGPVDGRAGKCLWRVGTPAKRVGEAPAGWVGGRAGGWAWDRITNTLYLTSLGLIGLVSNCLDLYHRWLVYIFVYVCICFLTHSMLSGVFVRAIYAFTYNLGRIWRSIIQKTVRLSIREKDYLKHDL